MKKEKLIARHAIKIDGQRVQPGKTFEADSEEARRLVALGVAEPPRAEMELAPAEMSAKELIKKIEAAEDHETLEALITEGENRKTVLEAAKARWQALETGN